MTGPQPAAGSTRARGPAALLGRQDVRFLLVGVANTAFAYAVFVALELTVGRVAPYLVVLVLTYVVGVTEAFVVQRWWVFRSRSPWLPAYVRFWSVYLVSLGVNLLVLPLLVEGLGLHVLVAQPLVLLLVAVGTFAAHRSWTFRAPRPAA